MATKEAPERPDWLVPGAEVVVAGSGHHFNGSGVRVSRVATVGAHYFTLDDQPGVRFRVATQDRSEPGAWGRWFRVYDINSPEAKDHLAQARQERRLQAARVACTKWLTSPVNDTTDSLDLRVKAIQALQGLDAE